MKEYEKLKQTITIKIKNGVYDHERKYLHLKKGLMNLLNKFKKVKKLIKRVKFIALDSKVVKAIKNQNFDIFVVESIAFSYTCCMR